MATVEDLTYMINHGHADGMARRFGLSNRGDLAIDMRSGAVDIRRNQGVSDEQVIAEEVVHLGAQFRNSANTGVPFECLGDKCADPLTDKIMRELRETERARPKQQ